MNRIAHMNHTTISAFAAYVLAGAAGLAAPSIARAQAESQVQPGANPAVMFTVNGAPVAAAVFEQMLANNLAAGFKDSPEMRQALLNELVARVVLAQEALKQGLDKPAPAQQQLSMARDGVLADLLLQKQAIGQAVSNEMLQAEYKRQVDLLADQEQVLLRNIVVETEVQAKQVLAALKAGASFEKLALEQSLDSSKRDGGSLGWLLPSQLIQPLANVVVNLSKGALAAAPIATAVGWQVIRLDDKRKFVPPTFEASKPQLLRALQDKQRSDYVATLMKSATIKTP